MEKDELVGLTLDRLLDHFKLSPESFEYVDSERQPNSSYPPTIFWQPKVQLNNDSDTVKDPNNNHAVIVVFNGFSNSITCYIFTKTPPDLASRNYEKADSVIVSCRWFEKSRGNYAKFIRLKDLIIRRDVQKENMNYLKKLSAIFPDTMDKHLLSD